MAARALAGALVLVLALLSVSLAVPASGGADREPVAFEDTFDLGLTGTTVQAVRERGLSVPRVQAFYSGYEYVVGYWGLTAFASEHARTGHDRQFGRTVAVYVTDFAGANVSLTDDGYLRATRHVAFAPADDTHVVVGSEARVPHGGAVAVPFSGRAAAAAFADEYGGEVVSWRDATDRLADSDRLSQDRFERRVDARSAWANDTVADARALRDRPTSIVVGEDAPTLAAALDAAPPNTTVELPPGTYDTDGVTVSKPVTVAGAGDDATTVRGDGNGSVVDVDADRVGLVDLRVEGVGDVGSRRSQLNESELDVSWSENVELAYGRGDAAVRLFGANESLVAGVRVETPSSGVIAVDSRATVVRDLDLNGTDTPEDGFMGVVAMYEPVVVEDSAFVGGRDGVYTHRADGVVVRDNRMREGRFGVHEMYTDGALVRNNTVRDANAGVIVMTRPTGNLVVGNDVRRSETGVSTAGSDSYFARNVVVDNGYGVAVLGLRSLLAENTVVGNDVGLRGEASLPTNLVTRNDVVDNGRPVSSRLGSLRVWTVGDTGNYWGALPGSADAATYDRPFRATGGVDGHIHDAPGAYTLARSPATSLLRAVQGSVPGLRSTGIVDTAPLTEPARPGVLAAARNTSEVRAS
ncbi:NosD domain-containing protein [Halobacterium jilantaiense]|uniref:Nitrous oxidase accessory protein NosD, contains tandem CASH domains n=1 Tax=Halobacterium jilantaiense TaxID=355548 RepID=A0A1I0PTU8_9EURY|nr:NosD domain-containing protein [Halobacterium jilantaiense]SEW17748.1 Nitrous oxidase accessory protein NosD, contains tandem CASH domains [Halobacterium jilantaiense]